MIFMADLCGAKLLYAVRFEAANGLAVEIPAGATLTAGPRGEVLADGKPVTWADAAMAPGPRVAVVVSADQIEKVIGVSPDAARAGDALCLRESTAHGGGAG